MPIYDYVCTSCRHRIEVIHGIHDVGPRFCPACGEEATMRKALVSPAVHFKGSGWAKKDRSSSSRARTRTGDESSAGGDSTAGGSAGGDSSDGSSSDKRSSDGGSRDGGSRDAASAVKDAKKTESGTASSSTPASGD